VKRRWRVGDAVLHHLIDPRTGRPSTSDAVQVTAITSSAALADYHAKVALLQGADAAFAYLNAEPDVEGLIVRNDGSVLETAGLGDYSES
jgi:thiamine biosynthesis lipoprotein